MYILLLNYKVYVYRLTVVWTFIQNLHALLRCQQKWQVLLFILILYIQQQRQTDEQTDRTAV